MARPNGAPRFEGLESRLLLCNVPFLPAILGQGRVVLAEGGQAMAALRAAMRNWRGWSVDRYGDTMADAASIEFGSSDFVRVRGRINSADDVDMLSFVAPASGTVSVRMQVLGRHRLGEISAYDAAGNLLARGVESSGDRAAIEFGVAEGQTYYLKVAGVNAVRDRYRIRLRLVAEPPAPAPEPVNQGPVAQDDAYAVDEDGALAVSPGVLANDSDADGDALSAVLVSGASSGTLALNADGSFSYTPNADFHGTDSFTYKASDGKDDSGVATVTITVNPVNDAPVAHGDAFAMDEDGVLESAESILANDVDIDGDALGAVLVRGAEHGALVLNADGTFTYAPDADFAGTDTFIYKAGDGAAESNLTTVTITVRPVNDAPTAKDDAFTMYEDESLALTPAGILANDADVDGDALVAAIVDGPQHGAVTVGADGSLVYTPDANWSGTDTLTYRAGDGEAESNVATVTITVRPVNDVPVVANDVYTVTAGSTLSVASPGVLANDSDADGDRLFAMVLSFTQHGSLSVDPLGGFTYTPSAGYTGVDTFTYMAVDQRTFSALATVTINVTPLA